MLADVGGCPLEKATNVLSKFTLATRPQWQVPPDGFNNRDWQPWSFRRQLPALRRPFLQIDPSTDPEIILAPGLVREAFWLTVRWYHDGDIHQSEVRSAEMESWIGHAYRKNGEEFTKTVEARSIELGWQTKREIELTDILRRRQDERFGDLRKFGDVDVLAWRDGSPRVLIIECKDVQFRKTPGEVAEQLADFRGELTPKGKPDLLRKHLDRIEVLTANSGAVAKRFKLSTPICLEGHLVFRNPVPMRYAWDHMASRVRLSILAELDRL